MPDESAHARATGPAPLRILFVLDELKDPRSGGTEGQFWTLYERLRLRGVRLRVALLRESPYLAAKVPTEELQVLGVSRLVSFRAIWIALRTAYTARRRGFRIAHVFFTDSSILFPIPFWLFGVKVIVSRRDLGFSYSRTTLKLLRLNRAFVSRVIANCEAVKAAVVATEGYGEARIEVIRNGLVVRGGVKDASFKQRWNLRRDSKVVVIVANVKPLKRITDAIASLHRLCETGQDAVLVVVGEDRPGVALPSHRAELESLAAWLGIAERLLFLGKLADPLPVIRCADVCLLCSETEGLSNTLMEYMEAARPVVCTNAGGNTELIEHEKTGLVVPIGEHGAMSDALLRLLTASTYAAALGQAARRRVRALCSVEQLVLAHDELYRRLYDGRKAHDRQ